MRKSKRYKLQYLFKNLEDDIFRELKKVNNSKASDEQLNNIAGHILYILSPYGKEIDKYRFFSKWREK